MSLISRNKINEIIQILPMNIQNVFVKTSQDQKDTIKEIRLRANKPIVVVTDKGCVFLNSNGKFSYILSDSFPKVSIDEINDTVKRICGYSVYSHQEEIINGFITIKGGHRIGLCGNAVIENGKIVSIKDINSVNIRVASEKFGVANELITKIYNKGLSNVIIVGAPMTGKTTILRDLIKQISEGNAGEYYKCVVVDERCEIAAINGSICENQLGDNTDVLSNYPKGQGISQAIRTLSPDIIFSDETASLEEANEILNGIMCGVHFAVTMHSGCLQDLYRREVSRILIESGSFDYIVLLGDKHCPGHIKEIIKVGDNVNENSRNYFSDNSIGFDGELSWEKNA